MQEPMLPPKRRTPWLLGMIVLALLTLLVLLQTSNLWRNLSIESAEDTIALYALSSLNFVAFIIFAFIFVRSLVKLAHERRTLQLGAKIKSRLLIYFVAISILPITAMAVFSYLYMNRALERWFTRITIDVLNAPEDVQNQALRNQTVKLNQTARMLSASLERQNITESKLAELLNQGNLTRISLLSKDGKVLAASERSLSVEEKAELDKTIAFISAGSFNEPSLNDGSGFDVAVGFFADGRKLVVVPDLYAEETINQVVKTSRIKFDELKTKEIRVRQIGFSVLGLLTFLLIFASTWTAFYVARGLTVPIKALAEGADEIAQGNLGYRVNVLAEDEFGLLIAAFNQMSSKLEDNSTELQERRRYIETVLQSLSTGVISFDANNRVTTINKAAVRMLKLEDGNFHHFELGNLVGAENREVLEKLINRAKRIGQSSEQTALQRERADGSLTGTDENMPVALTATSLPNAGGIVLVIEDLSELLQAQRASAWSEVARRMAHEIKNPLTPIQLSAERIAKRFTDLQSQKSKVQSFLEVFKTKTVGEKTKGEEQTIKVIKDGTDTILREVSSLKAMVDEFSKFARLPNANLEIGDLNEIIRQSVVLYEDRGAKIEADLAGNLPKVMIDEEQLKRVFVNLIENAVESFNKSQEDKKVSVKTFYDTGREIIVAEISDNGSGITPSNFQKLFQPYFSTKGRGTGLGLAIVQRIIIEHSGKIKAVNNSPRGAKFIVELPLAG